jgi:hypothetical protein
VAASDGFIPSDGAIAELFPEIVTPHSALEGAAADATHSYPSD